MITIGHIIPALTKRMFLVLGVYCSTKHKYLLFVPIPSIDQSQDIRTLRTSWRVVTDNPFSLPKPKMPFNVGGGVLRKLSRFPTSRTATSSCSHTGTGHGKQKHLTSSFQVRVRLRRPLVRLAVPALSTSWKLNNKQTPVEQQTNTSWQL